MSKPWGIQDDVAAACEEIQQHLEHNPQERRWEHVREAPRDTDLWAYESALRAQMSTRIRIAQQWGHEWAARDWAFIVEPDETHSKMFPDSPIAFRVLVERS